MENDDSNARVTAADANRMAQAFDDGATAAPEASTASPSDAAVPVPPPGAGDVPGVPSAEAQTEGDNPLEAEEREEILGTFPPPVPGVEIGGSVEEQAALREEYRQS